MVQVSLRYEAINVNSTCAATSRIEVPRSGINGDPVLVCGLLAREFPEYKSRRQ